MLFLGYVMIFVVICMLNRVLLIIVKYYVFLVLLNRTANRPVERVSATPEVVRSGDLIFN